MPSRSTLAWAAPLLAALALPAAASAAITQSQITTPAGPTFRIFDADKPGADPSNTFTVSGTSNGSAGDAIDVECHYSDDNGNTNSDLYVTVPVAADGSFTAQVVDRYTDNQTCRLRATPNSGYDDGDLPDFKGPALNIAYVETYTDPVVGPAGTTVVYDHYVGTGGLRGGLEWGSVSDCGPYDSYAYVNGSFGQSDYPGFDCALSLFDNNDSTTKPRSEIRIDGKDAFTSEGLRTQADPDGGGPLVGGKPAGSPNLVASVSRSGEELTSVAKSALVTCGPAATYPQTNTNCPTATGTGVSHERTTSTADGGLQVKVTDVWTSTDGGAHALDAQYDTYNDGDDGPEYLFGGESAFAVFAGGDEPALGAAVPGSVISRDRGYDGTTQASATSLTYAQAPQGARFIDDDQYVLNQTAIVPAGGSLTYTWVLNTSRDGAKAQAAAKQAEAALTPPPPPVPVPVPTPTPPVQTPPKTTPPVVVPPKAKACKVPTVKKGADYGSVRSKIKAAGCTIGKVTRVTSKTKKGRVISITPSKGTKAAGAKVAIKVSKGPAKKKKR